MSRSLVQAFRKGLLAAAAAGFVTILTGGLLSGVYGAGYAALLCPMISLPVGSCAFLWACRRQDDSNEG